MRSLRTIIALAAAATLLGGVAPADDDMVGFTGLYNPNYFAELQEADFVDGVLYLFGVGGLDIMDVSNPALPVSLGRYQPPGHPFVRYYRGTVSGEYAYCGAREDLLHVIDVQNPALPFLTGTIGRGGVSYEGTCIHGGHLYAAAHGNGVDVFELTVPAHPTSVADVAALVNSWDVASLGDHVYVADGAGGLAVLDGTDPAAPVHAISVPTSGNALDVAVAPGLVAVACGSAGVDIFDVTTPAAPVLLSTYDSAGLAISIELDGDKLYLADWHGVDVVDLGSPAAPVRIGHENTPVRAMGLEAANDRIYVVDWSKLRIYDFGPTGTGDIELSVEGIAFGSVPGGAMADTTFTIANTGGGSLQINNISTFNVNFGASPGGPITLMPGEEQTVTVTFDHANPGYDGTFLQVLSDDDDESNVSFPLTADDNPSRLDIGEPAPDFVLTDTGGVVHSLSQYQGKVVVMAFFANW